MARLNTSLILVASLLIVPGLTASMGAQDASPLRECAGGFMEGVGEFCLRADGLLEFFGPSGESLGTSHGPDPAPASLYTEEPISPPRDPVCVDPGYSDYHVLLIYARAEDDVDNYAQKADAIRTMARKANGMISGAAVAKGLRPDLLLLCEAGELVVRNEVLSISKDSASYGTITSALQEAGYTDPRVKFWVYYDDFVASFGGQGTFCRDDRAIVENCSNGVGQPTFALTYGFESWGVMLHELGHTLGAVQDSAPHATGAAHCNDGQDIMCYDDGGPFGAQTSVCTLREWDCGQDDYFNARPEAGNYLADHWNIGASLNRYLTFGPAIVKFECTARVSAGQPVGCEFAAGYAGDPGMAFEIDWSDGTAQRVPDSGFAPPATTLSASHLFEGEGTYTVTAQAWTDEAQPQSTSAESRSVEVRKQWPPEVATFACAPGRLSPGNEVMCQFRAVDVDGDPVRYRLEWGDGTVDELPMGQPSPADVLQTRSHTFEAAGIYRANLTITQSGAPHWSSEPSRYAFDVRDRWFPLVNSFPCANPERVSQRVRCEIVVDDPDSAAVSATLAWGDGAQDAGPPTPPGVPLVFTHDYDQAGVYSIQLRLVDDGVPPSQTVMAFGWDAQPPTVRILQPGANETRVSCLGSPQPVANPLGTVIVQRACATIESGFGTERLVVRFGGGCPGADQVTLPRPRTLVFLQFPICAAGERELVAEASDRNYNVGVAQREYFAVPGTCPGAVISVPPTWNPTACYGLGP